MLDLSEVITDVNSNGSESADVLTKVTDLTRKPRKKRFVHLHEKGATEPVFSSEPLFSYKHDPKLGREEKVVVTVKTIMQVHKNDRQEEQMKRPSPEVFGREAARQYVQGFVGAFSLSHDRLDWNLEQLEWAFSALEPLRSRFSRRQHGSKRW